ncbi:MAG TPA: rhomboid family intramembrane serine protease [Phycisphaerae bacterium]
MTLKVPCRCGKRITLPVVHVGRRAACPACKAVLRVVARDWDLLVDDFADTFVIQSGPSGVGEQFSLGGGQPIAIGKLATNDIVLNGDLVSRAHCQMHRTPSGWRLEDQKSRNGLFVNRQRVETHDLADGDVVRIGEFELRFHMPKRSAASTGMTRLGSDSSESDDDAIYKIADEDAWPSVPAAAPARLAPIESEGPICPGCGERQRPGVKICVRCGINVKTGRTVLTAHDADVDQVYITAENVIRLISWVAWAGIYPVVSEAFGTCKPYAIRALAALTIFISVWYWAYEWSDSPRMQSLKNLALWCGEGEPSPEQVYAMYEQTSYGDSAAFDEKYHDLEGSVPDQELTLAAHRALPREKQCFGTYLPSQLITHAFLHADPIHLIGNLLFLLVLGSRVNALIGNVGAAIVYPLLAIAGGIAHRIASAQLPPGAMIGASGAIMGLAGMYLVLFPVHKIHMAAWLRWGLMAGFHLSLKIWAVRGFWVVLFYIAFDVFYTAFGIHDEVAHWAHLGGFLTGAGLAVLLLITRLVNARGGDLVSVVLGKHAWSLVGKPDPTRKALLGG